MKISSVRGFTLMEVLVALGISMVIMAAMAALFAQSVKSRQQVDREGQKMENARFSVDAMAEDIRLAGFWATYFPPNTGSSPADWAYVSPCDVTNSNPMPGFSPTASPVQVPFAVYGFEGHGSGSTVYDLKSTVSGGVLDCLDDYKTGTDVIVVRRTSTRSVAVGGAGYVANLPYLQVSSCGNSTIDTQPFMIRATGTTSDFNLHALDCVTAANVSQYLVRIYYIADCNVCYPVASKDTVPTLKVAELTIKGQAQLASDGSPVSASCRAAGSSTTLCHDIRSVAPGAENLHFEYGVDTTKTVAAVTTDFDGSADSYILSNQNPRQTSSTGTALGGSMRVHSAAGTCPKMASTDTGEDCWEDVVSVKVHVVVRDLETTTGYTDTRSFVMGQRTVAAAGDAYRRKLASSTVKVVNMAGRREPSWN